MPPSAPTGLVGTAATEPLRVDLSWTAAADDTGVVDLPRLPQRRSRRTTTATSSTNVSVAPGDDVHVRRPRPRRGRQHRRRLGAAHGDDAGHVPPSAPGQPVGQALADSGPIDLTWPAATDNAAVTSYEVSRDGVVIGTATGTSYSDLAVGSVQTYTYAVATMDATGAAPS